MIENRNEGRMMNEINILMVPINSSTQSTAHNIQYSRTVIQYSTVAGIVTNVVLAAGP